MRNESPSTNDNHQAVLEKMHALEKEILRERQRKESDFLYDMRQGRIYFSDEAHAWHKLLAKRFIA